MIFKVIPSPRFLKDVKRLSKKYKSIKKDIDELSVQLQTSPRIGTDLGKGLYKIRLRSSDMARGKRGGFRVVYYLLTQDRKVYLLTIFPKTEVENIDFKKIHELLEDLHLER
jgi:mRNA-degrading endonuclease RelE of RelBE toxin-antitoxin system